MKREPIHLHDSHGDILCDSRHDKGVLTLSTPMAVMTSCPKCLGALDESCFTPITDEELAGLLRRARGTLARALEPLDVWLAAREAEAAVHEEMLRVLWEIHDSIPRRHFIRRARARRVIARHDLDMFTEASK